MGAGILGAKGAEGKRSDDSRARVVDALQGGGRGGRCKGGGRTVGRLFVHMYPVWLYEESLVTTVYQLDLQSFCMSESDENFRGSRLSHAASAHT